MNLLKSLPVYFLFSLFFNTNVASQQTTKKLTLDDVINIAQEQSLQSILAKHRFRGSYWAYRTYKAKYLPNLTLSSTIFNFDRSIMLNPSYQDGQWIDKIGTSKSLTSTGQLNLNQNIGLTGGSIFLSSRLTRSDLLQGDSAVEFVSSPISIGFSQPINGYNELRWEKKIEPKRFEEAKQQYIDAMEAVSLRAVEFFFDLALAQMNLEISKINYNNTDTLYKIAQGRYNMGTIAEDELLQLELSHLKANTSLNRASVELESNKSRLRVFLGFNDNTDLELIVPIRIPDLEIDVQEALDEANKNNPDIIGLERQLLEAEQSVAEARSERGLNATLHASFGLTKQAPDIGGVYVNPLDQQQVLVGIDVPIVDWRLGRGKVKLAESNHQVIMTSVQQDKVDFEQQVMLSVMQFNLQDDQILIAAKADTVATYRYEVAKRRFLIGKIDVLELNVALEEKDVARREYISALREFWNYYYNLRKLTLYDFRTNMPLSASFDELLK